MPPLPGAENLRIAGFMRPASEAPDVRGIGYRQGNAARFVAASNAAILHIVNDAARRWVSRGFAPAVRAEYPSAYDEYSWWATETPEEIAADRAIPGHWEGDLIIGLGRSAIGTLVERTTRFTMLLHLPRMEGHGTVPRVKNGPALAGHGAEAVRDAITRTITTLPAQLRRSLTWDQGAEMARHADLRIATGLPVYFCEPHSPWQRGTNENTNGLLRQYFPKGTDLSAHSPDVLAVVADALDTRPCKTLGWRTPAEALDQCLQASQTERVAATG